MNAGLQHVYEFSTREEWAHYAAENMKNITAERKEEQGIEIWLIAHRGVIGKWSEDSSQGYIEEYRDAERLAEDHKKSEE